jgi:2-(1,2-epoxy-1,2-dihydrophenyl)acetyl-CoA isomerase
VTDMPEGERSPIRTSVEGGVLRITLDRPEAGNSLLPEMNISLGALFNDASADPGIRAVVLSAAGDRHFCTGPDLRVTLPSDGSTPVNKTMGDGARRTRRGWQQLICAVLDCEKPVIARLNGMAAGAGAQLALACDFVLAAPEARLAQLFVRRGIAPDAGAAYLVTRLIGPQQGKRLFFFGEDVSASEALQLGLVTAVVPRPELDATVDDWADRLAQGPTKAIGVAKALVNRALESTREASLFEEAYLQEMVVATHDAGEGLRGFIERRPPSFLGW